MFKVELKEDTIKLDNELYLNDLRRLKKHITTAPTFVPRKFIDQIQFFYDGTDYKLYIYLNNEWKSVNLA